MMRSTLLKSTQQDSGADRMTSRPGRFGNMFCMVPELLA
jgi:hypothetical protein